MLSKMAEKIDFDRIDELIAWNDADTDTSIDNVLECIPESSRDDAKTLMKKLGDSDGLASPDTLYALALCRFYDFPQTALHVLRAGIPLPNNRTFEYNFKRIYFDERASYDARLKHNIPHNTVYLECHLEDILDAHHWAIASGSGGTIKHNFIPSDSGNSWDDAVRVMESY
jgi:hypothetical protein